VLPQGFAQATRAARQRSRLTQKELVALVFAVVATAMITLAWALAR
jgi:hypothetical protein